LAYGTKWPKNLNRNSGLGRGLLDQNYRFEQVNEITWTLTDGTMTNVPASWQHVIA
jgi:hypothetical protein